MMAETSPDAETSRKGEGLAFLIVDDHPLFCEALSLALASEVGAGSTRMANSLGEALALLDSGFRPDAALLDLNLPDVQGFDGLLRLKARHPNLPVAVVSALDDSRIVSGAIEAGAAGFMPKNAPRDQIISGLRKILDGGVALPPGYEGLAASAGNARAEPGSLEKLRELTPQQLRILDLVCAGKLNKQIAFDLSIAETTVKAHITAILRKLGVHSRTQAALTAREALYSEILRR
ncbi:response regulator transcription factor [Neomegalonema sp.]|uniref:response regulator n=1 Tax=Neomegalonema sp. TaxID=2039713 RepID=UPI00263A2646|nr:response regulator transcription factor [Neomegalonema sp.]MDD2869799.1 response regulator transcription factor [Neomegalonema sp.]